MVAQKLNKKHLAALLAVLTSAVYVTEASAIDLDVGASVTFVPSLSLTKVDMQFGSIEYSENAGANDITLSATDGALTCSNTTEYNCPPAATPGEVGVIGGVGLLVNVFCDSSGSLSNGTDIIDMQEIKISRNNTVIDCAGMGQAATSYTVAELPLLNKITMGGKIQIPEAGVGDGGEYATSAAGGQSINVRVVYQ